MTATESELRRKSDLQAASIDTRLALLEQSADANAKVADARWSTVDSGLRAIDAKMDLLNASMSEPAASPAGRALSTDLSDLAAKVTQHETFYRETTGALRLARFALGTSFVSVIGNIILAVVLLGQPHP